MNILNEVDTRTRLVKLMNRLPAHLISRWRKKVLQNKREHGIYPNIAGFLEFLEECTMEASDTVFGLWAQQHDSKQSQTNQQRNITTTNNGLQYRRLQQTY